MAKNTKHIEIDLKIGVPVMEDFYTIQGEGFWTGTAAYFVRLAGCDVGCTWCDVKDSWEVRPDQFVPYDTLMDRITESGATHVVITGGEPSRYALNSLCKALTARNLQIHIETAGTSPLMGRFDWICLSPKKFKLPHPSVYQKANELKVIIYNKFDFQWAEQQAELCDEDTLMFLQPEWSKREKITPLIVSYLKSNPRWKLSLQSHKYIDIP